MSNFFLEKLSLSLKIFACGKDNAEVFFLRIACFTKSR